MRKLKIIEKAFRLWKPDIVSEAQANDTLCHEALPASDRPLTSQQAPLSAPRTPAVTVRCFWAWSLSSGYAEPGQELYWSNSPKYPFQDPHRFGKEVGIWQLYIWHCAAESTTPLPPNVFAEALVRAGFRKRLVRDPAAKGRHRPTAYTFPEAGDKSPMQLEVDHDASRPPH